MDRRILALAVAAFALGTETYVFVGNLAALATDLSVSVGVAGQLASSFALTYAVVGPFLAVFLSGIERKRLLVTGLFLVSILNLLAALAPNFSALLVLRVLCGCAAAMVGPTAQATAALLVPPERRGRAMGMVSSGVALAFVLGIPLGSLVGGLLGWRATFAFAGALTLAALIAVAVVLPKVPSSSSMHAGLSVLATVAIRPAVRSNLMLTVLGFVAAFSVLAYIGPVATSIGGLEGPTIGLIQALIGVGSILGISLGARLADAAPEVVRRTLIGTFTVSAAALALYAVLTHFLELPWHVRIVGLALATIVTAGALLARGPIIQVRLVRASPEASTAALALNGSMTFLGQGLGAALGGLVIGAMELSAAGVAGALVALVGAALVLCRNDTNEVHGLRAFENTEGGGELASDVKN